MHKRTGPFRESIFAAMPEIQGISVVIPNYNGELLLPQILPAASLALEQSGLPHEIIVVDDCSTDHSLLILQEDFPSVKILKNEMNRGFSVTSNKGIRAALHDWVLLLNSDVKLEPDYFGPLLKYAARDKVFGVMGRIVGWEDEIIQDGAKYPFFHGLKIKTSGNYLLQDRDAMREGIYSMYLSGANAFLNKKIFLETGGLNEIFSPFYVEDFELSLRAWRLGFVCFFDYYAVCRHRTSVTIAAGNRKRKIKKIYNRNKMFLHAIHLDRTRRFFWFLQLAGESIIHLLTLRWSFLQAVFAFIRNYDKVKQSRRQFHSAAVGKKLLSVAEVADKIHASISGRTAEFF